MSPSFPFLRKFVSQDRRPPAVSAPLAPHPSDYSMAPSGNSGTGKLRRRSRKTTDGHIPPTQASSHPRDNFDNDNLIPPSYPTTQVDKILSAHSSQPQAAGDSTGVSQRNRIPHPHQNVHGITHAQNPSAPPPVLSNRSQYATSSRYHNQELYDDHLSAPSYPSQARGYETSLRYPKFEPSGGSPLVSRYISNGDNYAQLPPHVPEAPSRSWSPIPSVRRESFPTEVPSGGIQHNDIAGEESWINNEESGNPPGGLLLAESHFQADSSDPRISTLADAGQRESDTTGLEYVDYPTNHPTSMDHPVAKAPTTDHAKSGHSIAKSGSMVSQIPGSHLMAKNNSTNLLVRRNPSVSKSHLSNHAIPTNYSAPRSRSPSAPEPQSYPVSQGHFIPQSHSTNRESPTNHSKLRSHSSNVPIFQTDPAPKNLSVPQSHSLHAIPKNDSINPSIQTSRSTTSSHQLSENQSVARNLSKQEILSPSTVHPADDKSTISVRDTPKPWNNRSREPQVEPEEEPELVEPAIFEHEYWDDDESEPDIYHYIVPSGLNIVFQDRQGNIITRIGRSGRVERLSRSTQSAPIVVHDESGRELFRSKNIRGPSPTPRELRQGHFRAHERRRYNSDDSMGRYNSGDRSQPSNMASAKGTKTIMIDEKGNQIVLKSPSVHQDPTKRIQQPPFHDVSYQAHVDHM